LQRSAKKPRPLKSPFGRAARDRTASCAFALARLVRPRADSRVRTNRSSAFGSSLTEQARQPAAEPLNSPLCQQYDPRTLGEIPMFKRIEVETEEHLLKLVASAKEHLSKSINNVRYPDDLRNEEGLSEWKDKYKMIDKLNKSLLSHISNKDGVYALYILNGNNNWEIQYVGQTKSKTARQRIRSHIVWRNKNTKSGKITGSKFDEVQKIILSGKKLSFSFVEIHPAPLRHYVEETLIKDLQPPWNLHGMIKNKA